MVSTFKLSPCSSCRPFDFVVLLVSLFIANTVVLPTVTGRCVSLSPVPLPVPRVPGAELEREAVVHHLYNGYAYGRGPLTPAPGFPVSASAVPTPTRTVSWSFLAPAQPVQQLRQSATPQQLTHLLHRHQSISGMNIMPGGALLPAQLAAHALPAEADHLKSVLYDQNLPYLLPLSTVIGAGGDSPDRPLRLLEDLGDGEAFGRLVSLSSGSSAGKGDSSCLLFFHGSDSTLEQVLAWLHSTGGLELMIQAFGKNMIGASNIVFVEYPFYATRSSEDTAGVGATGIHPARAFGRGQAPAGPFSDRTLTQTVLATTKWVHEKRGCPYENQILIGHSLGGLAVISYAAAVAAKHPPPAHLILVSTPASLSETLGQANWNPITGKPLFDAGTTSLGIPPFYSKLPRSSAT